MRDLVSKLVVGASLPSLPFYFLEIIFFAQFFRMPPDLGACTRQKIKELEIRTF